MIPVSTLSAKKKVNKDTPGVILSYSDDSSHTFDSMCQLIVIVINSDFIISFFLDR